MKICLVANAVQHIREFNRLIKTLEHKPIDFSIYLSFGVQPNPVELNSRVSYYSEKLTDSTISRNLYRILSLFPLGLELYLMIIKYNKFKKFLTDQKIDATIYCEANASYPTELYIKSSYKKNIPAFILPYTIYNWKEPIKFWYHSSAAHSAQRYSIFSGKILEKIIGKKWGKFYKDAYILKIPLTKILSQKLLGFDSPEPLAQDSSRYAYYILESEMLYHHFQSQGFSKAKLAGIASYNFFNLHHRNLELSQSLKQNKKTICVMIPGDYTFYKNSGSEFDNYSMLLKSWLDFFGSLDEYNVIFTKHPILQDLALNNYTSKSFTFVEDIYECLIKCDIFIACISSTLKWARALGKVAINYDVYNFDYDEYKSYKDVLAINNLNDLKDLLSKFLHENSLTEYRDINNNNKFWGMIDDTFPEKFYQFVFNRH